MTLINTFEEQLVEIEEKYQGIRRDELERMNPWFSCVICTKFYSGCEAGEEGCSCAFAEPLDIDTFARKYNFKDIA